MMNRSGDRVRAAVRRAGCAITLGIAVGAVAHAQGNGSGARREVSARRLDSARARSSTVVLDGRIDSSEWRGAAQARDFIQQRPAPGNAASQRSEARLLLNGNALYVAMRLFDSAPESVAAPLARRDAEVYSDWAFLLIDSYRDRRTAFQFAVNPRGVQRDAQVSNDEEWQQDYGWNAVWQVETSRDSLGWTAEFRIPLSQLRFSGSENGLSEWGIQFGRHIARHNERSYWSPMLPERSGFVSQFGRLTDVALGEPARRLEVVPYTLAQITTRSIDPQDPLARARVPRATLGADVKWGLTPDFALTATVNPDFGQVESDPSEVNLTALESFFREQRPFFLEGAELFAYPMSSAGWLFGPQQLFYSRRIGRAPQVANPSGASFVDRPAATDLLGALKLTGRTAGWSVGVLAAATDEMRATVAFDSGPSGAMVVEPRTQYAMARVQKDFAGASSYVGAVGTAVLRDKTVPSLRRSALVSGLDFRHRFGQQRYQIAGYLLGSTVQGTEEAITATQRSSVHYFQRRGATHLAVDSTRTSLNGVAGEVRMTRIGGVVRWGAAAHVVSAGFEANDLGFHGRSDVVESSGWIGRNWFSGPRGIRNWEAWLNAWASWTLGGEREKRGQSVFTRAELTNFWQIEGTIEHHGPGLALSDLRGGPALFSPERLSLFASLTSDPRHSLVGRLSLMGARDVGDVGSLLHVSPQLTQRIAQRAEISLAPSIMWWRNPQQYVTEAGGRYVIGDIHQTTAALTARVDFSFTPRLSFQLYAQPFLSAAEYRRFGEVTNAQAREPGRRVLRFTPGDFVSMSADTIHTRNGGGAFAFSRPDFALHELRTNSVLRWEYRPGSALFLVWSHGRQGDGLQPSFDLRRQLSELADTRGEHVFLLKISHWLGR